MFDRGSYNNSLENDIDGDDNDDDEIDDDDGFVCNVLCVGVFCFWLDNFKLVNKFSPIVEIEDTKNFFWFSLYFLTFKVY